jgi:thiol-disulfide isomerase/thioredoxin
MRRFALVLCLIATLAGSLPADDEKQNAEQDGTAAASESTADALKAKPNDVDAMNAYMVEHLGAAVELIDTKPDVAEAKLAEMTKLLDALEPEEEDAKRLLARAKAVVELYGERLAISRLTLEQVTKKLQENPDDEQALSNFLAKVTSEVGSRARSKPDEAEKILNAAKKTLETVTAKAEEEKTKSAVERGLVSLGRYDDTIAAGKKLAALIGADAAALQVEAWVNGSPLTEADLKGKVVLLDFWAVWCGPCIATFPHLREWHEEYADKGLVIVGLTRYYNYSWDEEADRASRSAEEVAPEDEQKMLVKFAEEHDLHHRFAIQSDDTNSEFYGVSGIPHVVLIDRQGKVRLIRVGSGEANAKEIGEMLEKLIAGKG